MKRFVTGLAGSVIGAGLVLLILTIVGVVPHETTPAQQVVKGSAVSYDPATSLTAQEIYDKDVSGVVEITATFAGSTDYFGQSSGSSTGVGSGFVVSSDGYILTNAHVVSENGTTAADVQVTFNKDGKKTQTVPGTIVGVDTSTDVALIRVEPSSATLVPLTLGTSANVHVGQAVVAIGNPLDLEFSLSAGVVSATDRELEAPDGGTITGGIQTDASINPGNSGGPLINSAGEVIGINEQIVTQSGGNEGIGFAVPIDTAVKVMEEMKNGSYSPESQSQTDQGLLDEGQTDQGQIDPGQLY